LRESTQTNHSHQEIRAKRYAQAMKASGHSRIMELLPLIVHISAEKGSMLDMMSGTGFVSQYLGRYFDTIHAIDKMTGMIPEDSHISRKLECDASREDIADLTCFKYDTIISLASFHHIHPQAFPLCTEEQVVDYRVACLSKWRELIRDGGYLVLADVSAPGQIPNGSIQITPKISAFPDLEAQLGELPSASLFTPKSIGTEPSHFFDEFVAHKSITPHVGVFETELSLSLLLKKAGYTNIKTSVHFVPWHFQNMDEAIWFIHNLFGIGTKQYESTAEIPQELVEQIHHAIEAHLCSWPAGKGGIWIGWKLLYASAEKN